MASSVPRVDRLRTTLVVGAVAAAALGFVRLASEMREGETRAFDSAILLKLRLTGALSLSIGPPWLRFAMNDITALGGWTVLTLVTVAAIGFLLVERRWWLAAFVVAATAGGAALNTLLKASYARPRPDIVSHLVEVSTASFPSGHAMNSAVIYLTLGALGSRAARGPAARRYLMGVAVLLTLLIGFSRVFLGVHWPTDVIAGWVAGAAWASLCWAVAEQLRLRFGKPV